MPKLGRAEGTSEKEGAREGGKKSEGADNGSGQQNEYRHALFFPDL